MTTMVSAQDSGKQEAQKIKMFEVSEEEAAKYVIDTDKIEYATPVDGNGNSIRIQAESIPYYFDFVFDSNLVSQDISNTDDGATIYITSEAEWQDPEAEDDFGGSDYNYFMYSSPFKLYLKFNPLHLFLSTLFWNIMYDIDCWCHSSVTQERVLFLHLKGKVQS
ncbi:hypothetical protein LOK74_17615 [Brevibacillus humidisoli]|uniref:hypothetical protein n=1 Tax=Brevibacillus humidisoli TaxID=2895522 RepID=UPI001E2E5292|nr:hypothetical protein [Brevibacillus humidisoli]UFJ39851.1 hypothetical protein LOK74_17615 [Brevibacillus humidisoli]